jgi:hypothetical protein
VHNVSCDVAKNPTYSLVVRRPSDVRLVLTQRDAQGIAPPDLQPAALFVVHGSGGGGGGGGRAGRVHELTRRNVYAHSGDCVAARTVEVRRGAVAL